MADFKAVPEEKFPIKDLVPWPWEGSSGSKNPRKNDIAAKKLAQEIKANGFGAPILVQKSSNGIIAGHTRVKAAKILKRKTVPVRIIDCDDRSAVRLALSDNKLAEIADWDPLQLTDHLSAFSLEEVGLMGWDSKDLEDLADQVVDFGPLDATEVEEDEVPEPPKDPITKLGDVWALGRHTVVCGDARAFDWPSHDMVFTDPPYGVNNVGGSKDPRSESYRSGGAVFNDKESDLEDVVRPALDRVFEKTKRGGCWYLAGPAGPPSVFFANWTKDNGVLRQMLVWVKNAFVFGRSDYHFKHEMIFYGWKPGAAHRPMPDRKQDSVWEFDRPFVSKEHPTMKPVGLVSKAVYNGSAPGELICDPFLGSGTTLIACEQLGRTCVGTEIDPGYCDVIIQRWEKLTGEKATRA